MRLLLVGDDTCKEQGDCCQDYLKACVECPRTCGKWSCDEWINWEPSKYTCENLEDDYGCDCTGCTKCNTPPSPSPNAAYFFGFDEGLYNNARCLDGSMAGYYLRNGTNKYLFYFEGGGWCYDQNCEAPTQSGTIQNCKERAEGRLGSSKTWPKVQDSYLTGMLSADASKNPVFHDWTLVYLPYCDGMSWSGNLMVEGLHFRGRAILDAIIADVKKTTGIKSADTVVISGGSAGASAVLWHSDYITEQLDVPGKVLALPDAGFFLDKTNMKNVSCWPNQMRSLFDTAAGYDFLHKACLQRFSGERWKCMFPEYFADLITTPTLVLHSLYDESEITATLGLNCCLGSCWSGGTACTEEQKQYILTLRGAHIEAWKPLVHKAGNGVWAPACIIHTMTWGKWTSKSWEVPAYSGNTMAEVVSRWLAGSGASLYEDKVSWPNNVPCASYQAVSRVEASISNV